MLRNCLLRNPQVFVLWMSLPCAYSTPFSLDSAHMLSSLKEFYLPYFTWTWAADFPESITSLARHLMTPGSNPIDAWLENGHAWLDNGHDITIVKNCSLMAVFQNISKEKERCDSDKRVYLHLQKVLHSMTKV